MKKIIYLLLAICCLICPATLYAFDYYDFMVDGIAYNVNNDGASVSVTFTSCDNNYSNNYPRLDGTVFIPDSVRYSSNKTYVVTSIGHGAFNNCTRLKDVKIPNSVTFVGDYAFYNTEWLNNQFNVLVYAGLVAYQYKNRDIIMPEGKIVTVRDGTLGISPSCFSGHDELYGVNLPNSIIAIGGGAFDDCTNLKSIVIPSSVTSMGKCFNRCTNLTSVTWNAKRISGNIINPEGSPFNRLRGIKTFIFGNEVKDVPNFLCYDLQNLNDIAIPNSVISIGYGAFERTGWYFKQPNGALYLDNWLICYKGTKPSGSVTIREGTRGIVGGTFRNCPGLTGVIIPNSVISIGRNAFSECIALTDVTIPPSVTYIGDSAFKDCDAITCITIPGTVRYIGELAFRDCDELTDIYSYIKDFDSVELGWSGVFSCRKRRYTLHVPKGTWQSYFNRLSKYSMKIIDDLDVPLPSGDVNGDGRVNVSDVTALVNMILGVVPKDEDSADVNGDGKVNVSDVTALINIILGIP